MPKLSEVTGGKRLKLSQVRQKPESYADKQKRAEQVYGRVDPTEGNSFLQDAALGFGKSGVDTMEGVRQMFGAVTPGRVDERRRLDAPLMATGGGLTGNIVGQSAQIAVPVPAGAALKATSWAGKLAPVVGAAARSGAFGATQGVGVDESRAGNAAKAGAWGAGGQVAASGMGTLARGAVSRLDDATQGVARWADSQGFRLGMGQIAQNPQVRTVLSQMERLPFSGAGKRQAANQAALNRGVADTFGAKADRITPDVFDKAKTELSDTFERLTARNNLQLNTGHIASIKSVLDEAERLGGSDTARKVRAWANELMTKVGPDGAIPGKAYQLFDSRLGKQLKVGGEDALFLGQLRDAVRGAMDDSISAGDRKAWQTVRQQWAAMKTVEPLVGSARGGNIPPSQLMGRVKSDKAGKARMAVGKGGKLGQLAHVGQQFLKDAPDSGTADRLLVNAGLVGGLGGAEQLGWISPETAIRVGAVLTGNRGLLKLLNSRGATQGNSRALTGLARMMRPAPYLLPAAANAADD